MVDWGGDGELHLHFVFMGTTRQWDWGTPPP